MNGGVMLPGCAEGGRREAALMSEQDQDRLVDLTACRTEFEAEIIVEELKAEGVEARAVGGTTAGFRAEAPGEVKVIVHEKDLVRAKELLAIIKSESSRIDWSDVDVGEMEEGEEESK